MSVKTPTVERDSVEPPPIKAEPFDLQEDKQFLKELADEYASYMTELNEARLDAFNDRNFVTNIHYKNFEHNFPTDEHARILNEQSLENWNAILGHTLTGKSNAFLKLSPTITAEKEFLQTRIPLPFETASLNINQQTGEITVAFKLEGYDKQMFLTASVPELLETPGQISLTDIKLEYPTLTMFLEFSLEKQREADQVMTEFPTVTTIEEAIEVIRDSFSAQQIFEYCLFASNERETIYVQNENTEFVREVFSPLDPKTISNEYGVWVTRNEQIATQLEVTDPLTDPENPNEKEAGYMLGYPTPSIEEYNKYSDLEFKQQTLHLLSKGSLEESERKYLHLIQYIPAPMPESIRRAVEIGKQHNKKVTEFDAEHNTDIGRTAIEKQIERGFEKWKKAFK